MQLSHLQKYILRTSVGARGKVKPRIFLSYYDRQKRQPTAKDKQGIITKSMERLIEKGLAIGYGRRTPEKWFIEEIKLTPRGNKAARKLFGQQQTLPLGLKRIKK